ncbi:hypothetical protein AB205_0030820 [Aquarana catesbeiana]|uniref:Annexin n=1 Tax=Aquarana catesbeiana TaxID=8400 RepID=A0A2G9SKG8_AQUCT|nr:hypothetical protein AB205_0030820 [Aquarana catesbeiana]
MKIFYLQNFIKNVILNKNIHVSYMVIVYYSYVKFIILTLSTPEFKTDLEKDIIDDTSGDFQKALLSLLKGTRSEECYVDENLADRDAKALYEAGEKQKKANVLVFIEIFTSRSFSHLKKVFEKYSTYSKHDLNKALDLELKGDIEKCLVAIVKYAVDKPGFFAEKLHLAMKVH